MTLSADLDVPPLDLPAAASPPRQFRSKRGEVNGWLVLDKPVGMTSTHAVGQLKRIFNAKKAGHAGTLDPLASGILPIAFGEATKTVPFVQDGEKAYRFRVQWGAQTDTDDSEGSVVRTSDLRPTREAIEALLPSFTGVLMQKPPAYSAIKVNGERAYDRAREGQVVDLEPRPVTVHALDLVSATDEQAIFEAKCGKGTYVRAIARDIGEALGCLGHVTALRRTRVGPLFESHSVTLADLEAEGADIGQYLMPVETGLSEIAHVAVNRDAAAKLRRGQSLVLLGRDAPATAMAYATCGGVVVAFGPVEQGALVPYRVFNLRF